MGDLEREESEQMNQPLNSDEHDAERAGLNSTECHVARTYLALAIVALGGRFEVKRVQLMEIDDYTIEIADDPATGATVLTAKLVNSNAGNSSR
jgi:hypothetical protein